MPIPRLLALALGLVPLGILAQTPPIVLNEIVSSNVNGLPDEYEVDLENCPVDDCAKWYRDLGESVLDGDYPDWIEIHNPGAAPVSLKDYGLSDDPEKPLAWKFGEKILPPGGYLVVFASGKDKEVSYKGQLYLHTNFKLKRKGEPLLLANPQGQVIDRVDLGEIPPDFSWARSLVDPKKWTILSQPSPGAPNTNSEFLGFEAAPKATPPGGFFPEGTQVTLATAGQNPLRYTIDGSEPSAASPLYLAPIEVKSSSVIRARTFRGDQVASPILTQSYLVRAKPTMPVISLSTNPKNFFDPITGIYAPGQGAREGDRVANYWKDWERPVHIELYEADGKLGFSVDAGAKIFGWGSRANPQRALSIFLRDKYGESSLDYALFPNLAGKNYTAFTLRAGGTDAHASGTFFRDQFCSGLVDQLDLDVQACRPALLFINGRYYGIQDIREKMNEDYLAMHHGVDPDTVDIISRYWRRTYPVLVEGSKAEYLELEQFLESNDLSSEENYAKARRLMDMDHFITYTAAQVYFANVDWPGNNNKNWKTRGPGGQWRWLMYDLDYTMGFDATSSFSHNTLAHALAPNVSGWPNPKWTTLIMRRLALNESFRQTFANRICDLANSVFIPEKAIAKLDAMRSSYAPEMPEHIARWKGTGDVIASMTSWDRNIGTVRTFLQRRPVEILKHVRNTWKLGALAPVTLSRSSAEAGSIIINSIMTDANPWTGQYYIGVPLRLSAIAKPGYRFSHWSGPSAGELTSPSISLSLTEAAQWTAHFTREPAVQNAIVFTEINYRSDPAKDAGDWIEIHNAYEHPMDLTGWIFQDGQMGHRFRLPEGSTLAAKGYLVLCEDQARFAKLFPHVPSIGNFLFGLNNKGETLQLRDPWGGLADSVSYADAAPWPALADGTGPTLSLSETRADNAEAKNWRASAEPQGSPGRANESASAPSAPPRWGAIRRIDSQAIQWELLSTPGAKLQVEFSHDLKTWSPLSTGESKTGALPFEDPSAPTRARFYRARALAAP